jgi:hypothetical protein
MSYRGLPNWPPVWLWIGGKRQSAKGETGVLIDVKLADNRLPRIFLWMEDSGSTYIGCLLFENARFCREVLKFMKDHLYRTVRSIGDLDVSCTF